MMTKSEQGRIVTVYFRASAVLFGCAFLALVLSFPLRSLGWEHTPVGCGEVYH
jgi:hypothetical protein